MTLHYGLCAKRNTGILSLRQAQDLRCRGDRWFDVSKMGDSYFFRARVKYSVSRFESIWDRSTGGQRARTVEPSSAS